MGRRRARSLLVSVEAGTAFHYRQLGTQSPVQSLESMHPHRPFTDLKLCISEFSRRQIVMKCDTDGFVGKGADC